MWHIIVICKLKRISETGLSTIPWEKVRESSSVYFSLFQSKRSKNRLFERQKLTEEKKRRKKIELYGRIAPNSPITLELADTCVKWHGMKRRKIVELERKWEKRLTRCGKERRWEKGKEVEGREERGVLVKKGR